MVLTGESYVHTHEATFNVTCLSRAYRLRDRESTHAFRGCRFDVDLPAIRWVPVALGTLWVLRLLSGQTYPAVLLALTHHRCPVGGQGSQNLIS